MKSQEVSGRRSGDAFPKVVAVVVGVLLVAFGLWGFLAPESFHQLAKFDPYNRHYVHDIGAFQIGLGAVLLCGVWIRDALAAVLWGVGVGATFHLLSHVMDRDIGGSPSTDFPSFALMALLLIAAAFMRSRGGSVSG
ncbi:MAG TPA: hypothetical protein VNE62_04715 [Actinomycetota bacterium]|nr:hypothetical protein [Actinomycetota bacterium]